jgi:hypothetical protein
MISANRLARHASPRPKSHSRLAVLSARELESQRERSG